MNTFIYRTFFLLHLGTVVVGFGSSFVYPVLAVKARTLEARESYTVNHLALQVSHLVTTPFIYAAGAFGVMLIVVSKGIWSFSEVWISIAFALFIGAALIAGFLHNPNLKAMDAIQEKLANGDIEPPKEGGAPKAVTELQERSTRAGMYGGILHVLWLLLMIDMIWKPGSGL